jgi:hypothetical protein
MKIIKYLSLILAVALSVSCEKNVVEYDTVPADDMAEIQLHYMNPMVSNAATYIQRIEIGGKLVTNTTAILSNYGGAPGGGVGRFFTANPGNVNFKLYMKAKLEPKGDSLVYDQNATLAKGKYNVFVHDFTKPPVVFENGYPFIRRETVTTDSIAWVKFYNFVYESDGVPTTKIIQYQHIDLRTGARVNIGDPVAFGESTGWEKVTVVKTDIVSAGFRTVTYRMSEVDSNGSVIGDLMVMNAAGAMVAYTGTLDTYIGRRYHQIFAGQRTVKTVVASVRTFTAL